MTAAPPHLRYADDPHPNADPPDQELFAVRDVLRLVRALTYRQIDNWTRQGWIIPTTRLGLHGPGFRRGFPWSELVVIRRISELVDFGLEPRRAAILARKVPVRGRYAHQGVTLRITIEHVPQTAPADPDGGR